MSRALINHKIIGWAIQRSDLDNSLLAKKLSISSGKVSDWESGKVKPTFLQAQKIAKVLKIPFGYLFLDEPPIETSFIPDLRTVGDYELNEYSVDLKEVISSVIFKQDWYREYLNNQGVAKKEFVSKFNIHDDLETITRDINSTLELTMQERTSISNWEQFYNLLVERVEKAGVWVMRSGVVGSNTHRILNVDEFRGFTICDPLAPVIFINGADAKAAQIFTLLHEIAHLWLGASGVSALDFRKDISNQNSYEKKCNEIAAEFLVPQKVFRELWKSDADVAENAGDLSYYFKVSQIVVARRAFELDLIDREDYFEFYNKQVDYWKRIKEKRSGGGSYYNNLPVANGKLFTYAVLQSVYSQRLLIRDGAKLLGMNTATFIKFSREVGL